MWNTDISKCPRGRYIVRNQRIGKASSDLKDFHPDKVILATKCGQVTVSSYQPWSKRWQMLAVGEQPVAWHPYQRPLPAHPQVSP